MVYTGKPSRGCAMCKSRRIKCDERKPGCQRCEKSGKHCPGFPEEFDLLHRDEGKAMEERQRKKRASKAARVNGRGGARIGAPNEAVNVNGYLGVQQPAQNGLGAIGMLTFPPASQSFNNIDPQFSYLGAPNKAVNGNGYLGVQQPAQNGLSTMGMPTFPPAWQSFNDIDPQFSHLFPLAQEPLETFDMDTGLALEQSREPQGHIVPQYYYPGGGVLPLNPGSGAYDDTYPMGMSEEVQQFYSFFHHTGDDFGQYTSPSGQVIWKPEEDVEDLDLGNQQLELRSRLGKGRPRLDFTVLQRLMSKLSQGVPLTIKIPPEYEAVVFFINDFIMKTLPLQPEAQRGFFQLLVPLYTKAKPGSALHRAFDAVALAVCGNYPDKQALLTEAGRAYGQALRMVHDAINDRELWNSDELIVAVLLFSLYETIMSTNQSIAGWAYHVDGAVSLTIRRGPAQLKDPTSQTVFKAVRTMMITSCVQQSKPIKPFPGALGWKVTDDSEETAANRLTLLCTDLPDMNARAEALTAKPYDDTLRPEAAALIELAETIDSGLLEWYATLPHGWRHQIIKTVARIPNDVLLSEAEEWPGEIHAYQDVPVANLINDYRICRIFCQRVILHCLTWEDPIGSQLTARYVNAQYIVQQMVDEISACVPFHMSWDLQPVAQEKHQEKYAAEAFGGYSIMWPLYVAANAETVDERQKAWLRGRLDVIGTKYGLSTSAVLAKAQHQSIGPMFRDSSKGVEKAFREYTNYL